MDHQQPNEGRPKRVKITAGLHRYVPEEEPRRRKKSTALRPPKDPTPTPSKGSSSKAATNPPKVPKPSSRKFDSQRFLSHEHEEVFRNIFATRSMFKERQFILNKEDCHIQKDWRDITINDALKVHQGIKERGWEDFCKMQGEVYKELVYEFYANLPLNKGEGGYTSFVRGKPINFEPSVINSVLNTPFPPNIQCELARLLDDPIDKDETLRSLCVPGTEWTMDVREKRERHLKKNTFMPCAKIWSFFVQGLLLPIVNQAELTKKRALCTYCLVTGKAINVGLTIAEELLYMRHNKQQSLGYPILITKLCLLNGVSSEGLFPIVGGQKAVDYNTFYNHVYTKMFSLNPPPPSQSAPAPASHPPIHPTTSTSQPQSSSFMDQSFQAQMDVMHENMRSLHLMQRHSMRMEPITRMCAQQQGIDVDRLVGPSLSYDEIMALTEFKEMPGQAPFDEDEDENQA